MRRGLHRRAPCMSRESPTRARDAVGFGSTMPDSNRRLTLGAWDARAR